MSDYQISKGSILNEGKNPDSEMDGKYLTFWENMQLFGIPIADVVQIIGMQKITVMPDLPEYVKGIINLRGSIIPVMDVRLRLGMNEAEYTERTCIIVISIEGRQTGFIVDEVDEVTDIDDRDIYAATEMGRNSGESVFTSVAQHGRDVIPILNTYKLVSSQIIDMTMCRVSDATSD